MEGPLGSVPLFSRLPVIDPVDYATVSRAGGPEHTEFSVPWPGAKRGSQAQGASADWQQGNGMYPVTVSLVP